MTEQVDHKQRLAKAVAIILGVLLVACIVVFLVLLVVRPPMSQRKAEPAPAPAATEQAKPGYGDIEEVVVSDAVTELGKVDIPIPYGGRVVSLEATRYEILALVDTPEGQQAIVIDRNSGTILATLVFKAGAP